MTPIMAEDVWLFVKRDTVFIVAGCMRSLSITFEVEDIEISTVDSTKSREYEAGFSSGSGSFEDILIIDSVSKYQYEDFVANRFDVHDCRIQFIDEYGDVLQYDFKAKIQRVAMSAAVPDLSTYSVDFLISGDITPVKTYDHALLGGGGSLILGGDGEIIRVP